ncbi:DUF4265 domain-containing protein [Kineosporia succinea]|uniref:DUF4265 domain-containing protein n=1 Tax=Kineosporia succinea TaxID=84632 RepID=A0ABT9PB54_9ACTN|nr:DUF4265 domain-containing protein [Kineosporia succinea]MDP9829926.1 hypothetical protein [Kineosporia succinea]
MTDTQAMFKLWFKYPPRDGYPDQDTEGVWAVPISPSTARVASAPFHQVGVAPGDVVRFEEDEWGQNWALEIIEPSGHCVVRVFPEANGPLGWNAEAVNAQFAMFQLKGEALSDEFPLVAFDVPADADFRAIKFLLEEGSLSGWWQYEVAAAGDAWWAA